MPWYRPEPDEKPAFVKMDETSCPTMSITSWKDFVNLASAYMGTGRGFAYRGEANAGWTLRPSLLRLAPSADSAALLRLEAAAVEEFKAQAHLHLSVEHLPQPSEDAEPLEWWSLMQHYGAPTRFLDWTQSPFVAAYFAVEKEIDADGVIYAVDTYGAQERLNDSYAKAGAGLAEVLPTMFDPMARAEPFFWAQQRRRSARSIAQQGLVSVCQNIRVQHGKLLELASNYARPNSYVPFPKDVVPASRWIVPSSIKDDMMKYLRTTNIAAHSLFPGLDGLGRSVAEVARIGRPRIHAAVLTVSGSGSLSLSTSSPSVEVG